MGGSPRKQGDMIYVYKISIGKPEGKRPLGRPRRRWEENIIMALTERVWEGVHWMYLARDKGPVAGSCEPGNEPSGSVKGF
jgi:hypothetical protein